MAPASSRCLAAYISSRWRIRLLSRQSRCARLGALRYAAARRCCASGCRNRLDAVFGLELPATGAGGWASAALSA